MEKQNRPTYRKDPVIRAWAKMKERCFNPSYKNFQNWGGRGITVDSRWLKFEEFEKDMRPSYQKGMSLDRIDNNKNYSKDNCRWATAKQQCENKRNNHKFEYKGILDTLTNWAEYMGVGRSTLAQRIYVYKWTVEKTLTVPVKGVFLLG